MLEDLNELTQCEQRLATADAARAREDQLLALRDLELATADRRDLRAGRPADSDAARLRMHERRVLAARRDELAHGRDVAADDRDALAARRDAALAQAEQIRQRIQRDELPAGHPAMVVADRRQFEAEEERAVAAGHRATAAERRALDALHRDFEAVERAGTLPDLVTGPVPLQE